MKRSARIIRTARNALTTIGFLLPGSIPLALVPLEAQPLRSHPLDLLIKRVHLLVAPFGSRFWWIAGAYLVERLFHGEFFAFGHDVRVLHAKSRWPGNAYLSVPANAVSRTSPMGCHVRPSN